jgi:hypothetical protein
MVSHLFLLVQLGLTYGPKCGAPIAGADTPAIHDLKALACAQPRVSDKFNDHNYDMMYGKQRLTTHSFQSTYASRRDA